MIHLRGRHARFESLPATVNLQFVTFRKTSMRIAYHNVAASLAMLQNCEPHVVTLPAGTNITSHKKVRWRTKRWDPLPWQLNS